MKLLLSTHFKKDYQGLPSSVRKKAEKQLKLLERDSFYPSLKVKKIKGQSGKYPFWEARVDKFWRMSFQKVKSEIRLCRIGPHDEVLKSR